MSAISPKSQPSVPGSPDKPIVVNNHPNRLYFVLVLLGVACIGAYGVGVYALGVHQAAWGVVGSFSQLTQVNALIIMFSGGAGTVFVIGVLYSVSNHIDKVDDAQTEAFRRLQESEREINQLKAEKSKLEETKNELEKDLETTKENEKNARIGQANLASKADQLTADYNKLKKQINKDNRWQEKIALEQEIADLKVQLAAREESHNTILNQVETKLKAKEAEIEAFYLIDQIFQEKFKKSETDDSMTRSMQFMETANRELKTNIESILKQPNDKSEQIKEVIFALEIHKSTDPHWEPIKGEESKSHRAENGTFIESCVQGQFDYDKNRDETGQYAKYKLVSSIIDFATLKAKLMEHPLIAEDEDKALKILSSVQQAFAAPCQEKIESFLSEATQGMDGLFVLKQPKSEKGVIVRQWTLDVEDPNAIALTLLIDFALINPDADHFEVYATVPANIKMIYVKGEDGNLYSTGYTKWEFQPHPSLSTNKQPNQLTLKTQIFNNLRSVFF